MNNHLQPQRNRMQQKGVYDLVRRCHAPFGDHIVRHPLASQRSVHVYSMRSILAQALLSLDQDCWCAVLAGQTFRAVKRFASRKGCDPASAVVRRRVFVGDHRQSVVTRDAIDDAALTKPARLSESREDWLRATYPVPWPHVLFYRCPHRMGRIAVLDALLVVWESVRSQGSVSH